MTLVMLLFSRPVLFTSIKLLTTTCKQQRHGREFGSMSVTLSAGRRVWQGVVFQTVYVAYVSRLLSLPQCKGQRL